MASSLPAVPRGGEVWAVQPLQSLLLPGAGDGWGHVSSSLSAAQGMMLGHMHALPLPEVVVGHTCAAPPPPPHLPVVGAGLRACLPLETSQMFSMTDAPFYNSIDRCTSLFF